jgi:uncharacterized protein HemX
MNLNELLNAINLGNLSILIFLALSLVRYQQTRQPPKTQNLRSKMEQTFVTEREFNISNQRIADENHRQNERINMLEANYAIVQQLAVQMERLATNMETMAKELTRQGTKLNELEMKPSKRWDLIVTSLITGVVGAIVGMAMKGWIV